MLIHAPEISHQDGEIRVASRIEYSRKTLQLPVELWFSFPETQADFISSRSDGFLVTLLLLAMNIGEAVEVRGAVSPKLAYNLEQFQVVTQAISPRLFRQIDISFDKLQYSQDKPNAVVTSFSGGTDSLFSIWSQRNQIHSLPPRDKLTHGLFIHGFDLLGNERDLYLKLANRFIPVLNSLGMDLLLARSNFRGFYSMRVDWFIAHIAPLIGTALVMGKGIKRYIKPTDGESIGGKIRRPSYSLHLLSTEVTEMVLHAPHITRYDRIRFMADWNPAHELTCVCINGDKDPDGIACYRCYKCVGVGLYLDILDIQPLYKNFPRPINALDFVYYIWRQPLMDIYSNTWLIRTLVRKRRYNLAALYLLLFLPLLIKLAMLNLFALVVPSGMRMWIKRRIVRIEPIP